MRSRRFFPAMCSCQSDRASDSDDKRCFTLNTRHRLSTSIYWYIEKSLEDMLDAFMFLGKYGGGSPAAIAEMNDLIQRMVDLPRDFDYTSRQLFVSLVLSSIQRNILLTKACKLLLVYFFKRRFLDITGMLRTDFLSLLEQVLFRDVKKQDYLKPNFMVNEKKKTSENGTYPPEEYESVSELHPRLESRAYAEILVELFQKDHVNATQVLVYLEQLSSKDASYYHTDILVFLLSKVGNTVENKLSSSSRSLLSRNGGTPTSSTYGSLSQERSTFDNIYKRLESLVPYVITPESRSAYDKIMRDKKRSRSKPKKERSRESLTSRNSYFLPRRYLHKHNHNESVLKSPSPPENSVSQDNDNSQ